MPKVKWQGQDVDSTSLRFKSLKEEWNEYDLEDGTTVRMKAVVSDVVRIEGYYDQENNPIYLVKASNVVIVSSPDGLKKKQ
jgi:hypothetical protein